MAASPWPRAGCEQPPPVARAVSPRLRGDARRGQLTGPGLSLGWRRSPVLRPRRRLPHHRRRRQPFHRLHRLLGTVDPRSRRSRDCGGGGGDRRRGSVLRRALPAGGGAGRARDVGRPPPGDGPVRVLGYRGGDVRGAVGARRHRARYGHQVLGLLPRPCRPPAGLRRFRPRHLRHAIVGRGAGELRRPHRSPPARRRGGLSELDGGSWRRDRRGHHRGGAGQFRSIDPTARIHASDA